MKSTGEYHTKIAMHHLKLESARGEKLGKYINKQIYYVLTILTIAMSENFEQGYLASMKEPED